MKVFKKIAASVMAVAMIFVMAVSSMSVSAAGFASQMLTNDQRIFYDELVKKYVTEFKDGETTSFMLGFRDQMAFENEVTTEQLFMATAMFVADYIAFLPWLDMDGIAYEGVDSPFVAAVSDYEVGEMTLGLAIAMFAVKEEYIGAEGELFGYVNNTIKYPAAEGGVESSNMALNGTVFAESTALTDSNNPDSAPRDDLATKLANDGNFSSRWQAQTEAKDGNTTWVAVDLGSAKTFDRLRIYWETARANADGYKVQVSDDGEAWTDVAATVSRQDDYKVDGTNTFYDQVALSEAQTAKYVRLFITAGNGKGAPSIYEFEVYNGEPAAAPATISGIEITKAPDKTEYYVGTYPIPDLTGMELAIVYTDGSREYLNDDQIKALQGVGSADVIGAAVDAKNQALYIQYLGYEVSTPITMVEESPVVDIDVVTKPTGEGLAGAVIEATTAEGTFNVEIAEDAEALFAVDMMGMGVSVYAVECEYGAYLAMLVNVGSPSVMFMGCSTNLYDSFTDVIAVSNGNDIFVATNVADQDIPEGAFIKATYTITRDGETVTDFVIINSAWTSITLGNVELTSADFGVNGEYVTGILFTNVDADDEIDVVFEIL